jgi:signal transduction histidine kinase
VNAFVENINLLGKIEIAFSNNLDECRFDVHIETNVYRIICELIQNTIKHASASNVSLLIHHHENRMIIQYFDDGIGFDTNDSAKMNGMGLANMQSRLKALNGEIEFKRILPKGMMTSISLKTKSKNTAHGKT